MKKLLLALLVTMFITAPAMAEKILLELKDIHFFIY